LNAAQVVQDAGKPWGEAVENAKAMYDHLVLADSKGVE
jgi:hypothetical protein